MAVSLIQYCTAWTSVMDRMPPPTTLVTTTTATTAFPTHVGSPLTAWSASPAPLNCGRRYSQPMPRTSSEQSLRTAVLSILAWAKSGIV